MPELIDIYVDDRPFAREDWIWFRRGMAPLILVVAVLAAMYGRDIWSAVLSGDFSDADLDESIALSAFGLLAAAAFVLCIARQVTVYDARLSVRYDRASRKAVFEWRPIIGPVRRKKVHLGEGTIVVMRAKTGGEGLQGMVLEAQVRGRPGQVKSLAERPMADWLVGIKIVNGLNAELWRLKSHVARKSVTACNPAADR